MLIPIIVACQIAFGIMQRIVTGFGQVIGSFQFLLRDTWFVNLTGLCGIR